MVLFQGIKQDENRRQTEHVQHGCSDQRNPQGSDFTAVLGWVGTDYTVARDPTVACQLGLIPETCGMMASSTFSRPSIEVQSEVQRAAQQYHQDEADRKEEEEAAKGGN